MDELQPGDSGVSSRRRSAAVPFAAQVEEPQPGGSGVSSKRRRSGAAAAVPFAAKVEEPQPGDSGVSSKKRRAGAAEAVPFAAQVGEPQSNMEPSQKRRKASPLPQEDMEDKDNVSEDDNENIAAITERLARTHNKNRPWSKRIPANFGGHLPAFQLQPSPNIPPDCQTPLDYFKLFVDDKFVENIAARSQLYAVKNNSPEAQKMLTPDLIRTSQAIMFMTGYLTPSNRAMYWSVREDTGNSFVKKAMSRDTFKKITRFTYFVDSNRSPDKKKDRFWKVRPLFDQLNATAKRYVKPTEMVSVDGAMVKHYGPHPLKQYIRGQSTLFGYKIWVLATSAGQLLACQPYAGATKTMLPDCGLGTGPNVAYGLVKQFGLAPGTKAVFCDSRLTSLDLCDRLGEMRIGVVGTMRQNRCHPPGMPLPGKKEFEKESARGDFNAAYSGGEALCGPVEGQQGCLPRQQLLLNGALGDCLPLPQECAHSQAHLHLQHSQGRREPIG
jgi:hypothetical protein